VANSVFRRDDIVLFLGAGASVDAGMPDSSEMIERIEHLVTQNADWTGFRDLYRYIRSSIFFADGLEGIVGESVHYNIERLVNVLEELQKKERHALYPFVGAWNPKLLEVAGDDFARRAAAPSATGPSSVISRSPARGTIAVGARPVVQRLLAP